MSYQTRKRRAASERGRRMANARWEKDRERRDKLEADALAAIPTAPVILRRIIVIDREIVAREAVILESDSYRDARRKMRAVGL